MRVAVDKLTKILRLEQSQGYLDRAVIGGFGALAPVWQQEAHAEPWGHDQAQRIDRVTALLQSYAAEDPGRRRASVSALLELLEIMNRDSEMGESAPQFGTAAGTVHPVNQAAEAQPPAGAPPRSPTGRGLDAPVSTLPGIKTNYSQRLEKLGIATVRDLLQHYPHRYDDYRVLKPINRLEFGDETTVVGVVWETSAQDTRSGTALVRSVIADATGTIEVVWFNQPYLEKQLRPGRRIVLSGKVSQRLGRPTLQSPAWEPLEGDLIHTARLVPVYPLTHGVGARWMRRIVKQVVEHWAPRLEDYLPAAVRARQRLMDLTTATRQIHFPDSLESAEQSRRRLSFDEFLFMQLGMVRQRLAWQQQQCEPIPANPNLLASFVASLPFEPTSAQRRAVDQVVADLSLSRPMSRLLQGDVGSGKTVVAAAALLLAAAFGKQAALMAPTEILAQQHHRTISRLLSEQDWQLGRQVSVSLLTGSQTRAERSRVYASLASGSTDVVVGTHALIQRNLTFHSLGLVVVDEQHRFGVTQRAALRSKGTAPHVLVMSATPIPRSLALTIYGDLDLSVIDELPPGREPIQTRWLMPRERERAYAFVRSQVQKGRQAFILFPLIEESERLQVRAAVEEFERLSSTIFPDLRLGLLHGRMRGAEKDDAMERFRRGEIDVLASTSVIEVGIDVPNATVMLVEGADRFGLAQLHQFRGRVGRGEHQSYCLLLSDSTSPDDPQSQKTWERLSAIETTQDGFLLAEKDLELRGPGDFLGLRQSGLPTLRLARLTNLATLEAAREEAKILCAQDADLRLPEHAALSQQVSRFWQGESDLS